VDLHTHSTRSDGADTPQELIDHAASLGMKIIAITDHDIRPPKEIPVEAADAGDRALVDPVDYAWSRGLRLLRGIEISCETTAEDCHLVCLGCDWEDPFFDDLERAVVESKIGSYRELVRCLDADGMHMTWEEVLENGGNPVAEEQVQKKMIFELIARKGYQKDWSSAKLMVKNTPSYQILREKPDPVQVIRQVHRCGGIVIMAHPYLVNEPVRLPSGTMDRAAYIDRLIEAGLDGIEACYPYSKTSYGGSMTPEQIEDEVRERYSGRVAVISGGSDYHADFRRGVAPAKARIIGESGITLEYFQQNPLLQKVLQKNAP
jgi:fructose-bisphosphate aldolase class II